MLANPLTYEIMRPAAVGVPHNQIVLGKHSGRRALAHRLQELGVALESCDLDVAYRRFIEIADRKKTVFDQDLLALIPVHKPHATNEQLREAI
jgi:2-isopropylmalate synthase